jgi:hydrogenase maturation protease
MKYHAVTEERISIIGLGNVLMGDDAFGPYVIEILEAAYDFPKNVTLRDLGTPSLDLVTYFKDTDVLIVIDTINAIGRPGEVRAYRREEILNRGLQPRTNAHEPGLKEALLVSEFEGRGPRDCLLVGVIPEVVGTGVLMSNVVRNAVPEAVREVLRELERLNSKATRRAMAREPRIWWETQQPHAY